MRHLKKEELKRFKNTNWWDQDHIAGGYVGG
jgi:hypothetical protein